MAGRVGIKAVAAAAGVSVTTVSHVLNETAGFRVHPDTADRVRAAAEELGYAPNILARSLRSRRSHTIGFVSDHIATTPFAGRLVLGAQHAAAARGWLLLLLDSGGDPALEARQIETLLQRQVDGLLYAGMYHQVVEPPEALHRLPSVLLDVRSADPALPSVVPDETAGAREAVEELLRHGHRQIGFVTNADDIPATPARLRGYQEALSAAAVPAGSLVAEAPADAQGGYAAALRLLDLEDAPSALFCFNDRMAMGAYQAAATRSLRVPEDLSVVGFDDQEWIADSLRPALTTMALPHYAMGVWAAEALLARIEDGGAAPVQAMLPCPLVRRGSVAPPRLDRRPRSPEPPTPTRPS